MTNGPKQGPGMCGCLLFLIVVGIAGYFLLGFRTIQNPAGGPDLAPDWNSPAEQEFPETTQQQPGVKKHPDAGDWDMEDIKAVPSNQPKQSSATSDKKRSESGDWSMEEVDGGSKKTNSADSTKPKSKSTREGDWEIEEVDKKKK